MNAKQEQVLGSFVRVRSFLDATPLTGMIDAARAREMLDDALQRAREHVATQEAAPASGRAALRRQQDIVERIKDEHMRPMVTIARSQMEPGADVGLSAGLRMPTGKLGLQELLQWCDGMLEMVRPFEALFIAGGMPADFLARFAAAREELVRSMHTRARLTTAHVAARKGLQVELRRARLAVDRLDALVRACYRRDEAVLSVWRSTKRVHKLAGGAAMPSQRKQVARPPAAVQPSTVQPEHEIRPRLALVPLSAQRPIVAMLGMRDLPADLPLGLPCLEPSDDRFALERVAHDEQLLSHAAMVA